MRLYNLKGVISCIDLVAILLLYSLEDMFRIDTIEVLDITQTQKAKVYISKVGSKIGLKQIQKKSYTRLSDYETENNKNTNEDNLFSGDKTKENFKTITFDKFINRFKMRQIEK
ncbi:4892_t:CDS:2 [Dentiscutata erythropus]|uniref:4892_t:CDS:1 n=1 Tax=Dentiscutata erythropus TaxID=1348616 RepID=A0A9N9GHS7_9GLOM|nr:4892_t:CDS:2 [Dentiscutata erythropus]